MSFYGQYPIEGGGGGGGVTSLNALTGALTLVGAGGITITPSGSSITVTGSPTAPAGSNTQIQYNNAGAFGASPHFTFTDSPSILTLGTAGSGVISTATPTTLNLGNTYSSSAGTNIKLTLLDNTENQTGTGPYGFGVSAGSLDIVSGANFDFYSGGTKTIFISNAGIFPASAGTGLIGYSGGPFAGMTANAFYIYDNFSDQIASFTEVSSGLQIMNAFMGAPLSLITAAGTTTASGVLNIATGNGTGVSSGNLNISTGTSDIGVSGDIDITCGTISSTGNGGNINVSAGNAPSGTSGGNVTIRSGSASLPGNSGTVSLIGGVGGDPELDVGPNGIVMSDDAGFAIALLKAAARQLFASDGTTISIDFTAPTRISLGTICNLFNATSDPGSAVAGDIYFNTTLNVIRIYNGTTWQSVTAV